jgi:hypothetical protein
LFYSFVHVLHSNGRITDGHYWEFRTLNNAQ